MRAILFPKPLGFKFYKDSIKFILILCMLAACGMVYSIYCYIQKNVRKLTYIYLTSLQDIFLNNFLPILYIDVGVFLSC